LSQIESVLQPTLNVFEPGKGIEYDPKYEGDQYKYLYQQKEKELQDQLFELYEQIDEENDE